MNVLTLAKMMNVTVKDVESLLKMISDSMVKDGMTDIVINMSEEDRVNAVQAYMQSEVRKFSEFCVSLLVNEEKKSAFDQYMYHQIKG